MNGQVDLFGVGGAEPASNPYESLGYCRNPFRPLAGLDEGPHAPFFTGHITAQLTDIQRWVSEVHELRSSQPLVLVGASGTGKSRILRRVHAGLIQWAPDEKIAVHTLLLSDGGYARASVGALLVLGLERAMVGQGVIDSPPVPDDTLPLVWAMLHAPEFPQEAPGPVAAAFRKARGTEGDRREQLAADLSRWLRRLPLTPARARDIGLPRAIDWEGELVGVVAETLRLAHACGVLQTFFLLVDQVEELFRPTFSELRRARILTDLRTLVDQIEAGAPIGLVLSWTPEADELLDRKYGALMGRLRRRRVELPALGRQDAEPFAKVWAEGALQTLKAPRTLTSLPELVSAAWMSLYKQQELFAVEKITPRVLLTALATQLDQQAGLRSGPLRSI